MEKGKRVWKVEGILIFTVWMQKVPCLSMQKWPHCVQNVVKEGKEVCGYTVHLLLGRYLT